MKLLFLSFLSLVHAAYSNAVTEQEILEQCCQLGKNNDTSCSNWHVPIPDIPQEYQHLCEATMEMCCLARARDTSCSQGQLMAKEGQSCQVPLTSNTGLQLLKGTYLISENLKYERTL